METIFYSEGLGSELKKGLHAVAQTRTRFLAILTTLSLIAPAPAFAGPDDGKAVATQGHVDSPKTFWEDDNFTLKSEHNSTTTDLADTVAWIGKGWNIDGRNQYQFTLPDNGAFDFIGQADKTYYTAPANILGSADPIWLGFGADSGLPEDDFRDNFASLDILSVDGPGDFELFRYRDSEGGLDRFIGTTSNSAYSSMLRAGSHTHNYTLFTKPGRYEVTYRTTARKKDGTLVASEPTTTSLQIGGKKPADNPTPSLRERYDAATDGDASAAGYKLDIAPKSNPKKDGDENLSTISFNAENKASGTLTLLIDGYFLTDLPVTDGQAEWDEFLGPEKSNIQAVFTPEGSEPRWISQQVEYAPGATNSTDSTKSADAWEETHNVRKLAPQEEMTPTNKKFHAKIEPVGESASKVVVDTEDKDFNGFISGGFYEADSDIATLDFTGAVTNGHGEFLVDEAAFYDDYKLKLTLNPHPTVKAESGSVVVADSYAFGKTFEKDGALGTSPQHQDADKREEGEKEEGAADPSTTCNEKLVLNRGHIDIMATRKDDHFDLRLKDETNIGANKMVMRRLDDVVIAVRDNALIKRPKNYGGAEYDFMNPVGEKTYVLPQTQNRDIIWPGYNTEKLDYSQFKDGTVHLNLQPKEVPEGATFGMWTTGNEIRDNKVLMDSNKDDFTIDTVFASHAHTNWAFSKPGVYKFDVTYTATTTDGKKVESEPQELLFTIGDEATNNCAKDKPEPKPDPKPQPKPQPKPEKEKEGSSAEGSSFNPWSLVLPLVLATIFQAALNFIHDHRSEIDYWVKGITGR